MLHVFLEQRLQQAVASILPGASAATLLGRPCPDPKFGDYQTNSLMALAKERMLNPRALAAAVLAKLDMSQWGDHVEFSGLGFLVFSPTTAADDTATDKRPHGE